MIGADRSTAFMPFTVRTRPGIATEDFQRLSRSLQDYGLSVRIGFEATGNYHRTLAHHLGQAGFELKLVSSVALGRTRALLRFISSASFSQGRILLIIGRN